MPGRRLNDDERHLLEFWSNPPQTFPKALLRQVRVDGETNGLRGIQKLVMPFAFPFTAICGRNGVGKTTVIGLAAISSKVPLAWAVYWSNTRPKVRPSPGKGYAFSDFFHRRPGDPNFDGLRIGWVLIESGNEIEYTRQHSRGRWKRVADPSRHSSVTRFPQREIDVVPISRVLPPAEISAMRSAFKEHDLPPAEPLTDESLGKLSFILGKTYDSADTRTLRGLGLPTCRSGAVSYSGFHMGAGECAVITLLSRLQRIPTGGLLLVEELELGLHAEAQQRLVRSLIEVCLAKKLQIICTTHSEVILDSLPRQGRVLLRKAGADHEAITNVSTRFAIHEMAGNTQPELMIYAEDKFASVLIEESLPGNLRARVAIRDVGDKVTLARQAVAHLKMNMALRAVSIFDGDCTAAQIQGWISNERGAHEDLAPEWLALPGAGRNPERWVVDALELAAYRAEFAAQMNCSEGDASNHIESMRVQLDQHDSSFVLSGRTGLSEEDCRRRIIRSVVRSHPELDSLRTKVNELLGIH